MNEYELERMEPAAQRLLERDAKRGYELFKAKLLVGIENSGRTGTLFWRPAIEDHAQNFPSLEERLHFLVKWTRDALLALIDRDPASGLAEMNTLLGSEAVVLKRLALHALTVRPDLISSVDTPIVSEANLFDHELFHEMMLFLHQRFDLLPDHQQEAVHKAIVDGPPPKDGETEDDRRSRIDSWRRHLVGILPAEHRTAEEKAWHEQLGLAEEVSDRDFFLIYSTSGWVAESVEAPDLRLARRDGIDKLLEVLRENTRTWNGVRQLVQEDSEGMLDLAAKLEQQDFSHIWPYLDAYSELLKGGTPFNWAPLVHLCERVVTEHSDVQGSHIVEVSRFLRNGLESTPEKFGIPDDLLGKVLEVSMKSLDSRYTRLEVGLEDSRDTGMHQLNSAPGAAADALMLYVWRRAARLKQGDGIPPEANGWITAALDQGWGGMELRHAIGQFMNVLEWLQPGWIEANLPRLFPDGDTPLVINARKSLINGYLWSNPSLQLLRSLEPVFREVIPDSGRADLVYLDERIALDRLIDQVVIGWIWDLDGFGIDGLLGQLAAQGKEEARAHVVWFLGSDYAGAKEEWRSKLWPKMDEYWRWRVDSLQNLAAAEPSEELTRFCAWIKDLALPLEELESRLEFSIQHLSMSFGIHVLLESFVTRASAEPAPVSRLLELMVNTWAETPEMYWSSRDIESVIDALCDSAGDEEKGRLKNVADRLLATSGLDLRQRLQNCGGESAKPS